MGFYEYADDFLFSITFCNSVYLEAMKQFTLRIGVVSLKLKVKFACSISLSAKYHGLQHCIIEQKSLSNGQLSSPIRQFVSLEAECDKQSGEISPTEKVVLLLYLHSTHGRLLIGSYTYKLIDLIQQKTYSEKIKNSPDKEASIIFDIEAKIQREKTVQQFKDRSPISSTINLKKSGQEDTNSRTDRIKTYTGSYSPNPPLPRSPKLPIASNNNLFKSNVSSQRQNSPKNNLIRSNISSLERIADRLIPREKGSGIQENGKIQALRRKVSEMRVNSPENNQKYLQRIMALEKQQKASKERINQLDLELKISKNNIKFQEKQISSRKGKIENLDAQLRELESKNTHLQQKIREQQYQIKSISQEKSSLSNLMAAQSKKFDKKEDNYKQQLSQLNKRILEIEKERDTLKFSIRSLTNQQQETIKKHQESIRQKERRTNEQKSILNKRVGTLQVELQQSKHGISGLTTQLHLLQNQHRQLVVELKRTIDSLQRVNNQKQQLLILISKKQINRTALQSELEELKNISAENQSLKASIQYKQEEVETLKHRVVTIQQQLNEAENKLRMLAINNEGLEQQYQQLYYDKVGDTEEIQRKKNMITELIEENEAMSKSIERMNLEIQRLQIQSHEIKSELQQNIKQLENDLEKTRSTLKKSKNQLAEESQNRRKAEQHLKEVKQSLQNVQATLQRLQIQKQKLEQQTQGLKASNQILQNRIKLISDEFSHLQRLKEENQDKMQRQIQHMELLIHQKGDQMECMQTKLEQLNILLQDLQGQLQNKALQLQGKNKEFSMLNHQLEMVQFDREQLGIVKSTLEQNNSSYQGNIIELNEKIENLQLSLRQLQNNFGEIDNSLRPQHYNQQGTQNLQQLRLKKLQDLHKSNQQKDSELEKAHKNILNLQDYAKDLRIQVESLKDQLRVKCEQLDTLQRSKNQIDEFMQRNLNSLIEKLHDHFHEPLQVNILRQSENLQNDQQGPIITLQSMINETNLLVTKIINQNLEKSQAATQNLKTQLTRSKEDSETANQQIKAHLQKLKKAQKQQQQTTKQANKMKQKIDELIRSNNNLQNSIKQQKSTNNSLSVENSDLKNKIEMLSNDLVKTEEELKKFEEHTHEIEQQMDKKINLLKTELSEKSKQLVVSQNQRKSRIQILNQSIDQLRKQNYELQSLSFSQKNNQAKLSSIFTEISNYLPKIEKAHNIKAYYMMPIRELLTKFQQILKSSQKNYADFEKKIEKREATQNGSASKLQRKLSLRKIPSQLK